jgi:purine-binding chemotaxis protein CheW
VAKTATLVQLVLFIVDEQTYALPLAAAERVLRIVEITPLPGAPDSVEGVINIQGDVVIVVSVRRRLGLAERSAGAADSLIVARARARRVAIIAESVVGVVERPVDAVVSAGHITPGIEPIEGVLKTSEGLVLIHDLDRFFSATEEQFLDQALERL